MTDSELKDARQSNLLRILVCLSLALALMMAVTAGLLIWRARGAAAPPPDNVVKERSEPDYTFTATGSGGQRRTAAAEVVDAVAPFELIERSGRKVTNEDLLGRPWAVCFIFTNCAGPCPRVTGQMKLLQDRFAGKPLRLVTITVDPERDTPERLANYAENFGADKQQWLFLTGDQQTIYPLIRDSFGLSVQEETGPSRKKGWEITHSTRVVHVDAGGRIRGKYNALNEADVAQLAGALEKEIAALKADGGEGETERGGEGERGR